MTQQEYHALLLKADEVKARKQSALDSEHAETVGAIHRVWALMNDGEPQPAADETVPPDTLSVPRTLTPGIAVLSERWRGNSSPVGPTAHVRKALEALPVYFRMPDVARWLEENYPGSGVTNAAISSALNKLQEQGKVKMDRRGKGKNDPSDWVNLAKENPDGTPAWTTTEP